MSKKSVSNVGKVYNQYTDEYRRDAVAMIESEGLTTAEVGRRLGVNANLLRKWRNKYGKRSKSQEVQSDLEAENRRLRDEVRRLQMEREILKKAAARRNGGLNGPMGPLRTKRTEISVHFGACESVAGVGDVSGSAGESVGLLFVEASSGESTADPSGRDCFRDEEHSFGS
jgi:transposase